MPRKSNNAQPQENGSPFISALLRLFLLAAIWGGIAGAAVLGYFALDLPDVRQVVQQQRRPAITFLAQDGTVIARYGDHYGRRVTLNQVPRTLVQAVVSIEDRRFFDHFGVDVFGLFRAAVSNMIAGHVVQGGSTLTQQLAKNLFLSPERTFKRKIQEMMLALWLEHTYSKEQIITAYLNRVYLGAGTYGVDAASETYFGQPVEKLSLLESAVLAGLLRAPSRYAPTNDPAAALARAKVVLGAMVEAGAITESQRVAALVTTSIAPRKPDEGFDGRYFADWIVDQIGGMIRSTAQDLVVTTTLDSRLQRVAERKSSALLASATGRNVSQVALVTLATDGAVKAMVGGEDYNDSQFNRATQAMRQPGSSFKPIVYLAAIKQGMTPDEVWQDAPIQIGSWSPENYEHKYQGSVTAREALAESINTVAVRVLQKVTPQKAIQVARALGINSPMEADLSLALGTNSLTPLELTGAYATLAAGGHFVSPYAVVEVKNRDGQVLFRRTEAKTPQMVDAKYVRTLVDMMETVVTSGTGKKAMLDRPVAGKTGTTSDFHDAWFVGFTADYTTGVWLGNDNNKPMKHVSGGTLPTQLWHDYMVEAERGLPARDLLEETASNDNSESDDASSPSGDGQGDDIGSLIRNLFGGSR